MKAQSSTNLDWKVNATGIRSLDGREHSSQGGKDIECGTQWWVVQWDRSTGREGRTDLSGGRTMSGWRWRWRWSEGRSMGVNHSEGEGGGLKFHEEALN